MADEVSYAAHGDLVLSEAIQTGLELLAGDRPLLPSHPAFLDAGNLGSLSSTVIKRALAGLGLDEMTALSEGAGSSNTPLQDGSYTLTLGRHQIQRDVSGLLAAVLSQSQLRQIGTWLMDFDMGRRRSLDRSICLAGSGFSSTIGTSGAPLTLATFEAARNSLDQAGIAGPYVFVGYRRQLSDLKASLSAVGGTRQYIEPDRAALDTYGQDYQGNIMGVDCWGHSAVPSANSGADSAGFMCGAAAIAHGFAPSAPFQGENTTRIYSPDGRTEVELSRNASTDQTLMVARAYFGVARTQQALGRKIISRR
jgi:hypothetical protein